MHALLCEHRVLVVSAIILGTFFNRGNKSFPHLSVDAAGPRSARVHTFLPICFLTVNVSSLRSLSIHRQHHIDTIHCDEPSRISKNGSARMNRPGTSSVLYRHWCTPSDLTLSTIEELTLLRPMDCSSFDVTFGTL